jgi:peptidoglycan/LPS O-acetylase OafA/YrhL
MALEYRREIDGLRALAVGAVVAYHASWGPDAGFVGVDIFFVISGYLITALLLREHQRTGRIDMGDFYARRVRRIFPALILVVACVLAGALLLLPVQRLMATAESAMAAAAFASNVYFLHSTLGYFSDSSETLPLLHLWSLSVEEQFYLAWPLIVIVALRWRWPLRTVIAICALASFALAEFWLSSGSSPLAFFLAPARGWELAAGAFTAASPARPMPRWAGWLSLLVLVDAVVVPLASFPAHGALPAVLGAAGLLAFVHGGGGNPVFASAPAVGLGRISYSLYLWHWPLLALYAAMGGTEATTKVALACVALVLAIGSYRYVEQPLRRRGSRRTALAVGACALVALGLTAFTTQQIERRSPEGRAAEDRPSGPGMCSNSAPQACEPMPRIVIWGDSMAGAWLPLAQSFGPAIAYTKDGCKAVVGYENATRPGCRAWAEGIFPAARHADTLLLAGRWEFEFYDRDFTGAQRAMRATLEQLRGVRRVILVGPTPTLRDPAPRCVAINDLANCAVSFDAYRRRTARDRAALQALAAEFRNVEYLEAGDWFCDRQCTATRDGLVLYYDQIHPSATAAAAFAKDLAGDKSLLITRRRRRPSSERLPASS